MFLFVLLLGCACYFLVISCINNECAGNVFYNIEHFVLIINIFRLVCNNKIKIITTAFITTNPWILLIKRSHKELWTQDNFMSIFHVLWASGSRQEQFKLYNHKFCIMVFVVINVDFEFFLELLNHQAKHTTYF